LPKTLTSVTRLRTAPAAREDVRGIRDYSKTAFGARVAKEYLDGLTAVFTLIETRPLAGIAEPDLGEGMRSFGFRSHRIYYKLEGDDLLVVRILHSAQHIPEAFGPSQ
jgi:toxin ParE1/3/4